MNKKIFLPITLAMILNSTPLNANSINKGTNLGNKSLESVLLVKNVKKKPLFEPIESIKYLNGIVQYYFANYPQNLTEVISVGVDLNKDNNIDIISLRIENDFGTIYTELIRKDNIYQVFTNVSEHMKFPEGVPFIKYLMRNYSEIGEIINKEYQNSKLNSRKELPYRNFFTGKLLNHIENKN